MLMVALVAGCGLLEIEALRLYAGDVDLAQARVRVAGGRIRGRPGLVGERWVWMPRWVLDIFWATITGIATLPLDAPLFPCRGDPTRPRSSFARTIRQAAEREGLAQHPKIGWQIYSLTALRRLPQALARAMGAPRSLVRGTVPRPSDAAEERRHQVTLERASRRLAANWITLVHPPRVRRRLHLPRKAPKKVGPLQAEVTGRRKRSVEAVPVPWSSRPDAPMLTPRRSKRSRPAGSPATEPRASPEQPSTTGEGEDSVAVAALLGVASGYLLSEWQRRDRGGG
jgi:hypothetical protein